LHAVAAAALVYPLWFAYAIVGCVVASAAIARTAPATWLRCSIQSSAEACASVPE